MSSGIMIVIRVSQEVENFLQSNDGCCVIQFACGGQVVKRNVAPLVMLVVHPDVVGKQDFSNEPVSLVSVRFGNPTMFGPST